MILKKIITGFVTQTFDTNKQQWVNQEFTAGDEVEYETEDGDPINETDFEERMIRDTYLPMEMIQPD